MYNTCIHIFLLIVTVSFSEALYIAPKKPTVILSKSSQCPVTIHVSDRNITAKDLSTFKGLQQYCDSNLLVIKLFY